MKLQFERDEASGVGGAPQSDAALARDLLFKHVLPCIKALSGGSNMALRHRIVCELNKSFTITNWTLNKESYISALDLGSSLGT
jgi:hypothetical protein